MGHEDSIQQQIYQFSLLNSCCLLYTSGIAATQEMLDFCGKHNIVSDVEVIAMEDINDAYERMLKSGVKYRFVIDMATLKAQA